MSCNLDWRRMRLSNAFRLNKRTSVAISSSTPLGSVVSMPLFHSRFELLANVVFPMNLDQQRFDGISHSCSRAIRWDCIYSNENPPSTHLCSIQFALDSWDRIRISPWTTSLLNLFFFQHAREPSNCFCLSKNVLNLETRVDKHQQLMLSSNRPGEETQRSKHSFFAHRSRGHLQQIWRTPSLRLNEANEIQRWTWTSCTKTAAFNRLAPMKKSELLFPLYWPWLNSSMRTETRLAPVVSPSSTKTEFRRRNRWNPWSHSECLRSDGRSSSSCATLAFQSSPRWRWIDRYRRENSSHYWHWTYSLLRYIPSSTSRMFRVNLVLNSTYASKTCHAALHQAVSPSLVTCGSAHAFGRHDRHCRSINR